MNATVNRGKPFEFKLQQPTIAQMSYVGAVALHTMQDRIAFCINANDLPAKPYSPKGPIYVPVTGKGRTKTQLKGREVITAADIRKIRRQIGGNTVILQAKGSGATMTKLGLSKGAVVAVRSKKSLKFANYADYKRFLGKSGNRDNQLSGRMLGALAILEVTPAKITIGFNRYEEELKAQGNQRIDPFFGLSPKDKQQVMFWINQLLGGHQGGHGIIELAG